MRISVTQQCNLDCFYCHHEGENGGDEDYTNQVNGYMTPGEIEKIIEIGSKLGIEKLKITGGEPLMRKDILEIVKRVSRHMKEISMTTNGVLLKRYAKKLKDAGLNRINVSLDAFNPVTYQRITNKDLYHEVRKGVEAAVEAGLCPVKLNMVVLKEINHKNIPHAIEFASDVGAILQLIEFESSKEEANNLMFRKYHHSLNELENELAERAFKILQRNMHRRRKFILPSETNGKAEVEVVRGMHNSVFCNNCTRLRVTSKGELKPCLLRNDNHINIINPIRGGKSDDELVTIIKSAILLKEPYWRR